MSSGSTSSVRPGFKGYCTLALIRLVGALPLGWARGLGATLGWLAWQVQDRGSLTTQRNLQIAYPEMDDAERRRLARASMIETGKLATEICVVQQCNTAWLKKRVLKVEGEGYITNEVAKGKGIIFLAPHLGNWEVLGLTLAAYGQLTALYQPPKQAYLEPLIKKAREKTGAQTVPTNRKGLALLLRSLRSGGITAVLPDQNPNLGFGEFAPFFGKPAYTMTTVHGFLQRTDCAVVMGFVKRVPGGFETHFLPAPKGVYADDLHESLAALNAGVEACIAHCPEQYQWEYKRFKRHPEGKDQYAFR